MAMPRAPGAPKTVAQGGRGPGGDRGSQSDFPGDELPLGSGETCLPWLEAGDEDEGEDRTGPAPLLLVVLIGLLLIALLAGGLWFAFAQRPAIALVADGGVVRAPAGPYKVRPGDPGGGIARGTGDSSFLVAEGRSSPTSVGTGPAPSSAADGAGEVGVQIGAFATPDAAEAAWTRLAQRYPALAGLPHRVVEGRADLGTVHALQAIAGNADAASALCRELRAAALNCQLRH